MKMRHVHKKSNENWSTVTVETSYKNWTVQEQKCNRNETSGVNLKKIRQCTKQKNKEKADKTIANNK